ncbi:DUF262 domain-containing protein [Hymenobacter negativus]|uniref:DUF262 domain-containing protein n=1 Tax=Hymenobacter negativus TaxID=2795026 RepID=A0ABS0Q5I8_9BACT|nr:DUF262 domain-containing protein [Hymenobacter negativus]MBH8557914.1 DUF262 domain-containing protein [Hymenobacter negativus]
MKATETKLLGLLEGRQQFTIPIYQRPYSWTLDECQRLLHDIRQVGQDDTRPTYFIGSVVYFEEEAHAIGTIRNFLVIDGQQRLTTMVLLLKALANYLAQHGEPLQSDTTSEELTDTYLTNRLKQGDLLQRLLLTKRDKETLIAVVNGNPLPSQKSERVAANFALFEREVAGDVATLWEGIKKLMVVSVALQSGVDNPQLIFESLNSTGRPLDQSDLIRNYVLMGQLKPVQDALYDGYWYPMEAAFGDAYSSMFGEFMRDFLTMKLGSTVNIWTVYQTFKTDYAAGRVQAEQVEGLVKELYYHATYYVRLRQPEKEEHAGLRDALKQLRNLEIGVAYPYLLSAYAASAAGQMSKEGLVEVVQMIEAYLMRRAVCALPTNTLSNTFASFGRQLNGDDYLASVKARFLSLGWARRFPKDEEFRRSFIERNSYHFGKRKFLLSNLENYGRKERVNVSEYTLEHIMPQNKNLSEAWQRELGDDWVTVHDEYLHTIGNLTLTGYNSEMSDRPFAEKKALEGGFVGSPIRLNKLVATATQWNLDAILHRADALADIAVKIWPVPTTDEPVITIDDVEEELVEENESIED